MDDRDKSSDEEAMQDVSEGEAEHETVDDGEVGRLEMRVLAMPDEKSVHEDLVAALRNALVTAPSSAAADLRARLRKARTDVAARWPQGYDFWEDWLVDEFGPADQRVPAERERLRVLCADAFAQTHAVDVLLLECDLVARWEPRAAAIAAFEHALACAGCHVTEGAKLWDAYRTFLEAHPDGDGSSTTSTPASTTTQREEILALYQRELALPLAGMDAAFAHFSAWAETVGLGDAACRAVEEAFAAASAQLAARAEYERAVCDAHGPVSDAAAWERYIAFECAQTPPVPERVVSLYERALAACAAGPEAPALWAAYSAFVAAHMPQCARLVDTHSPLCVFVRGVWHCSCDNGSGSAGPHVFLALLQDCEHEGCDGDTEAVTSLMLGAMAAMRTPEQALELANGIVDWHVRKYHKCLASDSNESNKSENSAEACKEHLVGTVDRLCDTLGALFGRKRRHEAVTALVEHLAKLQYAVFNAPDEGRRLYERVMSATPAAAAKWLKYAELERCCRGGAAGIAAARSLHRRALAAVTLDGVQAVISSWVELERLHGSLDNFRAAWQACCTRLYTIQQQQQQQQQQKQKQQEKEEEDAQKGEKRRRPSPESGRKAPEAESEVAGGEVATKEEPRKRMRLDLSSDGSVVMNAEHASSDASAAATAKKPTLEERLARSVHVTGLPRSATQEEVHRFFAPFGDIVAVRLGRTRTGTLRGFGFVEFADAAAAARALAQGTGVLGGRTLTIERCEDKTGVARRTPSAAAAAQLFVSNLDFAVTEEELRALFAPRAVTVLKIHRAPDGRSKGFGFVRFATAADAEDALHSLNRTLLRGRELKLQPFQDGPRAHVPAAEPAQAPSKTAPFVVFFFINITNALFHMLLLLLCLNKTTTCMQTNNHRLTFAAPRSLALKRKQ